MTPVRLQRSRKKGSRLTSPNGLPVVCVTRGTKWGNPFVVGADLRSYCQCATKEEAVEMFRADIGCGGIPTAQEIRRELRGKNLACWCRVGDLCHADVLLEIANEQVK